MLSLHPGTRYFVYQGYVNMLKSFNGLCGIVTNELRQDLLTDDVFIFFNKRRTASKSCPGNRMASAFITSAWKRALLSSARIMFMASAPLYPMPDCC